MYKTGNGWLVPPGLLLRQLDRNQNVGNNLNPRNPCESQEITHGNRELPWVIKSYYLSAPNSERNDQIIAKHCQSFNLSVWAGLIAPTRDLFTYPLNSFASRGFTGLAYGRPVIVFSTVHLLSLQKNHPTSTRHYWLAAKDRMPPPQPPGSPLIALYS